MKTLTIARPLKLFDELENWDEFFEFPKFPSLTRTSRNMPAVDIQETEKEIMVKADLPGLKKEDITISFEDNILSIKGEKKEEKTEEGKTYLRSERFCGSFIRDFPINAEIDVEKVNAKYNDGVLELALPKKETEKNKVKTIEIK
jgi:HSP20 family protein